MKLKMRSLGVCVYVLAFVIFIYMSFQANIVRNELVVSRCGQMISLCTILFSVILALSNRGSEYYIHKESILIWCIFFWAYVMILGIQNNLIGRVNVWFLIAVVIISCVKIKDEYLDKLISITVFFYLSICFLSLLVGFKGVGYDNLYVDMNWYSGPRRLRGILQHANGLGAIALIPIVYESFSSKPKVYKIFVYIMCASTLYLTQSKTNIAVLFFIFAILLYKKYFYKFKNIDLSKAVLLGIFILMTYSIFLGDSRAFSGRMKTWLTWIPKFLSKIKYWFIGIGDFPESFHYLENMYLDALVCYGIIGLGLLLVFLFRFGKYSWKRFKLGENTYFCFFIVMIVRFMTESFFLGSTLSLTGGVFFYILLIKKLENRYIKI